MKSSFDLRLITKKLPAAFFPTFMAVALAGLLAAAELSDVQGRQFPDFRNNQGWLGADDAYSIPLGGNRSVWLFGDTFVADRDTKIRSQYKVMVRNAVGISTCPAGSPCTMVYFWKNAYTPKARSFFDTGTDDLWYWPLDAYFDDHKLFVSLLAVRNKPNAFDFEIAGTKLAVVNNVEESPEKWQVAIKDLTDGKFWPGTSIVAQGNYVLWYTQVIGAEGKGYMTVLRVPKEKIATPWAAWEYLEKDGSWGNGLPGVDAMHVIEQAVSEMSVRYHPSIHKWVAILPGPIFPSRQVVARLADSPIGPWSAAQTVFEFPEMNPDHAGYDKDTFCYAAKEHTEFTDTKMAMTYACNSNVLAKTVANTNIYRPRVVMLDLPH